MTEWIQALEEAIGADKVLSSPIDLIAYSFDGTFEQHVPDAAVLPVTAEEVSAVVRIASQYDIPSSPGAWRAGWLGVPFPLGAASCCR